MSKLASATIALILGLVTLATSVSAEIIGVYLRNGEEFILVRTTDEGLMYCTRVGDGFEMCDGLTLQDDGVWRGTGMKHPNMPKFMTYTGAVLVTNDALVIEGCTTANAQCDAETWPQQ
jgi:hypothetical protein